MSPSEGLSDQEFEDLLHEHGFQIDLTESDDTSTMWVHMDSGRHIYISRSASGYGCSVEALEEQLRAWGL